MVHFIFLEINTQMYSLNKNYTPFGNFLLGSYKVIWRLDDRKDCWHTCPIFQYFANDLNMSDSFPITDFTNGKSNSSNILVNLSHVRLEGGLHKSYDCPWRTITLHFFNNVTSLLEIFSWNLQTGKAIIKCCYQRVNPMKDTLFVKEAFQALQTKNCIFTASPFGKDTTYFGLRIYRKKAG